MDFSSQIAYVSLVVGRYNLLGSLKRSNDDETMDALFSEIYSGVHEPYSDLQSYQFEFDLQNIFAVFFARFQKLVCLDVLLV